MTDCVICHTVCDDSGLCDDHKYDEQQATESSDSDQPHVHKLSEAHQWWADCYPQHRGRTNG